MRTIVVTGGIATGKTTACQLLQQALPGAVVFDCDACVHELLTNDLIKEKLRAEFGEGIFIPEDEVDRSLLGEIVFADAARRAKLEGILHPEVLRICLESRQEASRQKATALFVADVPLFYEADFPIDEDRVLVIASSRSTQVQRLVERGGMDVKTAERMLKAQMPLEEKLKRAHRVLWNEKSIDVLGKQLHYVALLEAEDYGY